MTPEQYRNLNANSGFTKLPLKDFGKPKRQKPKKPTRQSLRDQRIALLRNNGMPDWEIARSILMERPQLNWSWRITDEQRICIEFADRMRRYTQEGKYRGIFGHVANEGKRHQIVATILLAMGMITGGTDYFFMWNNGGRLNDCGVLECKIPGGGISPMQSLYAAWCKYLGIPHAYFHSVDEAEAILKSWGALP